MNLEQAKKILRGRDKVPTLYMPIEHPAFAGWQVKQPCAERMSMITQCVCPLPVLDSPIAPFGSGTVLDVGCHTGWFCRAFARMGWQAIGIDKSGPWLGVAKWMNDFLLSECPVPEYIERNVLDADIPVADVALCLSTAMYMFADEARGWDTLLHMSLSAPTMFLDFGGQYADRVPFGPKTAMDAILEHTEYTEARQLGVSGFEERPLYVFTR